MSRYIDADRLRKDILGLPNCYNGFSDTYDKALIIDRIDEQPTADVRENVRGEWLHISDGYCDILKCSQCGKTTDSQSNYCPNCGCLMKGEKAENLEWVTNDKNVNGYRFTDGEFS